MDVLKQLKNFCIISLCSILLAGCTLPFRKAAVSGLQVTTEGVPASVFLNGAKVGSTPFSDQTLKPGSYTVRLEPEDKELAAYETSIILYPTTLAVMNWTLGKTAETSGGVVYELEPLKKKQDSQLSISSIPDGAIVKVDDVSQGFTPILLKSMTSGTHRFQLTLPSYKAREESVNIAEGFQMNIIVKLAKDKAPISTDEFEATSSSDASTSAEASSSAKAAKTPDTKNATSSATSRNSTTASSNMVTIKETGTGWLRVRATPDAAGKELVRVDVGETFEYSQKKDGWYEIEYEKGKTGWVSGQYVTEK